MSLYSQSHKSSSERTIRNFDRYSDSLSYSHLQQDMRSVLDRAMKEEEEDELEEDDDDNEDEMVDVMGVNDDDDDGVDYGGGGGFEHGDDGDGGGSIVEEEEENQMAARVSAVKIYSNSVPPFRPSPLLHRLHLLLLLPLAIAACPLLGPQLLLDIISRPARPPSLTLRSTTRLCRVMTTMRIMTSWAWVSVYDSLLVDR